MTLSVLLDLDTQQWLDRQLQALVTVAVGHRRKTRLQLAFSVSPAGFARTATVRMRLRATVDGHQPQHHNLSTQWYITLDNQVIRAEERQQALPIQETDADG